MKPMKPVSALFFGLALTFADLRWFSQTTDNYKPGPDSKPQRACRKASYLKFTLDKSKNLSGYNA